MDSSQIKNIGNDKNSQNESRQDARLEKLKFEVSQEMGINRKVKNKKK